MGRGWGGPEAMSTIRRVLERLRQPYLQQWGPGDIPRAPQEQNGSPFCGLFMARNAISNKKEPSVDTPNSRNKQKTVMLREGSLVQKHTTFNLF